MNVLLDTHFVLWVSIEQSRLSAAAIDFLNSAEVQPWFSVASIWEIAIKTGLRRPGFRVDVAQLRLNLLDNGYSELEITSAHAMAVADLPPIHRDPFDRLLVAQATVEGIQLLTSDATLAKYPGPIRHFG